MTFDEMNPAPPVTRTRFGLPIREESTSLELFLDGVERPSLDVPLDAPEVLADQGEDEPLEAEHEEDRDAAEERAGEVCPVDPEVEPVGAEAERQDGADRSERDADPLDRLRPEAGQDVERQPHETERRVARLPRAGRVPNVDLDDARPGREDERLRELLLADRPEDGF